MVIYTHKLDNSHNYDYNKPMKSRCYCILHSIISLLVGITIYILFRKNTYIHTYLSISPDMFFGNNKFLLDEVMRYALPDFLWSYSLNFGLYSIYLPNNKWRIIIPVIVSILGFCWEILQKAGLTNGTFDIIDCVMYVGASMVSYIIYLKEFKK